jgi:hypothetical protein
MDLVIKNIDYIEIDFNNLELFYKWLKTKLGDLNWKFRYHHVKNVSTEQETIDKDYFYSPKEEIDYIMLLVDDKHGHYLYYLRSGDTFVLTPNIRSPFVVNKGEVIKTDVSLE